MKRSLILPILIIFATMSCAGPNKAGWTKPDFRQDEFEKDREECIQRIGNHDSEPELFGERLERCLAEKNYKYFPSETEVESPEETSSPLIEVLGYIIRVPFAVAYLTILPCIIIPYGILGGDISAFFF